MSLDAQEQLGILSTEHPDQSVKDAAKVAVATLKSRQVW